VFPFSLELISSSNDPCIILASLLPLFKQWRSGIKPSVEMNRKSFSQGKVLCVLKLQQVHLISLLSLVICNLLKLPNSWLWRG
jgi:hypothetical protein